MDGRDDMSTIMSSLANSSDSYYPDTSSAVPIDSASRFSDVFKRLSAEKKSAFQRLNTYDEDVTAKEKQQQQQQQFMQGRNKGKKPTVIPRNDSYEDGGKANYRGGGGGMNHGRNHGHTTSKIRN
eukprot:8772922-Ditylum_brightwellii.AAC.1